MRSSKEQTLEEKAFRLEGQVLRGVAYQGVVTIAGDIHTATHAVHLELESKRVEVTTADEVGIVHGYGIALRDRKVVDPAYGPVHAVEWNVEGPIVRALIHWGDLFEALRGSLSIGISIHADHLRRRDYPATLELRFATGVVFISAARLKNDLAKPLEPELLICFSEQTRKRLA